MPDSTRMPRPGAIFTAVIETVEERKQSMPQHSYVANLMRSGIDTILCKVAEETGELIKSAREENKEAQTKELCDLLFHLMVMMVHKNITFADVEQELAHRHGISGLDEKARRPKKN